MCSALFYKYRIKARKSKVICSKPCRESVIEQKRSQQQIKKYFSKNKALKIHKGNVALKNDGLLRSKIQLVITDFGIKCTNTS